MLKRFFAIRIDEILSLLIFLSVNKIILHNQLEKITYVAPLPGTIKVVTQLMHQYFIDKKCKKASHIPVMNHVKQYQWAFETQFSFGHTLWEQFTSYEDQSS